MFLCKEPEDINFFKNKEITCPICGGKPAMIHDLIKGINNWLSLTGKEFVYDPKMFRFEPRQVIKQI